jgi:hypothetical protein
MVSELVAGKETVAAPTSPPRHDDQVRPAAFAFAVIELAGFIFYVVAGRHLWFYRDEWDFLAAKGFNAHDLIEPHGGHLSVVPLAVYRAMYSTFGLHSYVPYQVLTILLHLAAAALLWIIMRRAGVHPWLATVIGGAFVFFGTASQDIIWAFQVGFSGALVFGLVQLVLSDHDGPIDRRDWWGLAAGVVALLCAGVAVATVLTVGLATLVRRGWRPALFHTAPLGILYGAWWLHYTGTSQASVHDPSVLWAWFRTGVAGAFGALGQVTLVGWAIAIMLVAGGVLAWRQYPADERRRRLPLPAAMLVGSAVFLLITGVNRAWVGTRFASSSRYMHVTVALLLPALAVAGDALVRRWRGFAVVVPLLFLIGIPGNIAATGNNFLNERFFSNYAEMIKSLPRMDLAPRVPRDFNPEPINGPGLTVGWLIDAAHSGSIPPPNHPPTPKQEAEYRLRLSLEQQERGAASSSCEPVPRTPESRNVAPGQSFVVLGLINVVLVGDGIGTSSNPVAFGASLLSGGGPHTLTDVGGEPLTLKIWSGQPNAMLCGLPAR